jgi:hypothetical protein
MNTTSIIVQGTIASDGTLTVDRKIPMPAGRVQITIQPAPDPKPAQKDWWQRLQEARVVLETRGTNFRSQEEIEAERDAFRANDPSGE